MINKLRRRFIVTAMCSVFAVLTVIMSTIGVLTFRKIGNDADRITQLLIENEGRFPKRDGKPGMPEFFSPGMSAETPYETRFFTVLLDENNGISEVNTGSIAAVTTAKAGDYAYEIARSGKTRGYKGVYRYGVAEKDGRKLIVFVDCSRGLSNFDSFCLMSALVCIGGMVSVLILVLIFSRIAVKPIAETYAKQKQFITDAGHEIKTPLTIIDANTEVIELESGETEWTRSIKTQVERLSALTSNLIDLSRMDERGAAPVMLDFSLSDAVNEALADFEMLIKSNEKTLTVSIEDGISFTGDEKAIRRLISLLTDNAIKYSSEHANINVTLLKRGRQIELRFENPVEKIDKGNLDMLFERFYRADSSRNSESGGYGIGLSVAKAIVEAHKGAIKASSPDGKSIIISATF